MEAIYTEATREGKRVHWLSLEEFRKKYLPDTMAKNSVYALAGRIRTKIGGKLYIRLEDAERFARGEVKSI